MLFLPGDVWAEVFQFASVQDAMRFEIATRKKLGRVISETCWKKWISRDLVDAIELLVAVSRTSTASPAAAMVQWIAAPASLRHQYIRILKTLAYEPIRDVLFAMPAATSSPSPSDEETPAVPISELVTYVGSARNWIDASLIYRAFAIFQRSWMHGCFIGDRFEIDNKQVARILQQLNHSAAIALAKQEERIAYLRRRLLHTPFTTATPGVVRGNPLQDLASFTPYSYRQPSGKLVAIFFPL